MYVGEVSNLQLVSIGLMLLFAFGAMFFIGYHYSYSKAIVYANEQIEEAIETFKMNYNLIDINKHPDLIIGNIDLNKTVGGIIKNE